MEYEDHMRPEKHTMPNYFSELSGFEENNKSHMTVLKYSPVYEIEMKKNNIEVNYSSEEEYSF